jgi:hypothetical protein
MNEWQSHLSWSHAALAALIVFWAFVGLYVLACVLFAAKTSAPPRMPKPHYTTERSAYREFT